MAQVLGVLTTILLIVVVVVVLTMYFFVGTAAPSPTLISAAPTATEQVQVSNPIPPVQATVQTGQGTNSNRCDPATEINHGWTNDSVSVARGHYVVADVGRGRQEVTVFDQGGTWTPVDGGVRVGDSWDYGNCDPAIVQKQAEQHAQEIGVPMVDPTALFSHS